MRALRATYAHFSEVSEAVSQELLFPALPPLGHLRGLYDIANVDVAKTGFRQEIGVILEAFATKWKDHAQALTRQIQESCPEWFVHKDTLLDHKDIMDSMSKNKHYGKIGPLSAEARQQIKLIKQARCEAKDFQRSGTPVRRAPTKDR